MALSLGRAGLRTSRIPYRKHFQVSGHLCGGRGLPPSPHRPGPIARYPALAWVRTKERDLRIRDIDIHRV